MLNENKLRDCWKSAGLKKVWRILNRERTTNNYITNKTRKQHYEELLNKDDG